MTIPISGAKGRTHLSPLHPSSESPRQIEIDAKAQNPSIKLVTSANLLPMRERARLLTMRKKRVNKAVMPPLLVILTLGENVDEGTSQGSAADDLLFSSKALSNPIRTARSVFN